MAVWAVACADGAAGGGADAAGPADTAVGGDTAVDAAADTAGEVVADGASATGADAAFAADIALGPPPTNLGVHHWATFTVFHAAAAKQHVPGVARAEEVLPAFVHTRSFGPAGSGAQSVLATPPLAKIQTAGAFFKQTPPAMCGSMSPCPKVKSVQTGHRRPRVRQA